VSTTYNTSTMGPVYRRVLIDGVNEDGTEVKAVDGTGWRTTLDGTVRPKGTAQPEVNEVWLIERLDAATWILRAQVGSTETDLGAEINAIVAARVEEEAAQRAEADAQRAAAEAALASGIVDGTAVVLIQDAFPTEEQQTESTLWIDTTNGLNRPRRWDGTQWIIVVDQGAIEAARAAVAARDAAATAREVADAAKATADAAKIAADEAVEAAENALAAAAGKGRIIYGDPETTPGEEHSLLIGPGNVPYIWDTATSKWIAVPDEQLGAMRGELDALVEQVNTNIADLSQVQEDLVGVLGKVDGKSTIYPIGSSPTLGPEDAGDMRLLAGGGVEYWDGTQWKVADPRVAQAVNEAAEALGLANTKSTTYYKATKPTTADIEAPETAFRTNDLWLRTEDNRLHRWNGVDWIEVKDAALTAAEGAISGLQSDLVGLDGRVDGKSTIYVQDTAPTDVAGLEDKGDIWIDTYGGGRVYKVWDGDSWEVADDPRVGQALADLNRKVTTYYAATKPTGSVQVPLVTGDLWLRSSDNRLHRYDGANWVELKDAAIDLQVNAVYDWARSRGTDLVTNGTGYRKNNDNFSGLTFNATDAPAGATGSFDSQYGVQHAAYADEYIPVDAAKTYLVSAQAKQRGTSTLGRFYIRLLFYTNWGLQISRVHVVTQGSIATLTAPLNPGDTTIAVDTTQGWTAPAGSIYSRYIGIWNYVDPNGKTWAPGTFTNNRIGSTGAYTALTSTQVTLATPYAGPALPAGTKISNMIGGDAFTIPVANYLIAQPTWTPYSLMLKGSDFPAATATMQVSFLCNYGTATDSQVSFASISVSDAAAARAIADGKATIWYQAAAPTLTASDVGDLWIKPGTPNTYQSWTGSAWVDVTDAATVGILGKIDKKVTTYYATGTTAPSGVTPVGGAFVTGDLWVHTTDKSLRRYDGASWVDITDSRLVNAANVIGNYQGTLTALDGKVDAKAVVYYQTADPSAGASPAWGTAQTGDIWIDSTNPDAPLYKVWTGALPWKTITDPVATQALSTVRTKVTTYYKATQPVVGDIAAPETAFRTGDLWIRTTDKRLHRYDGSNWVELKDSAIDVVAGDLNRAVNLIDNPSRTGVVGRWTSSIAGQTLSVADVTVGTTPARALRISNNVATAQTHSAGVFADGWDVDPTKAYMITVDIWDEKVAPSGTQFYFGLTTWDSGGSANNCPVIPVPRATGVAGAATANHYFSSYSAAQASAFVGQWRRYTAYLMPHGTDPALMKDLGSPSVVSNAILGPNAAKARIRILNYSNDAANPRYVDVLHPTVVEVDPNAVLAALAAQRSAATAQTTADGKNSIYYADVAAPGPGATPSNTPARKNGDRFINRNGTTGEVYAEWVWETNGWKPVNYGDSILRSLSVGKLVSGFLSADVTVSGTIKTAVTGARAELTNAGLKIYDANNAAIFDATGGNLAMTGLFETTQAGGMKIAIKPRSDFWYTGATIDFSHPDVATPGRLFVQRSGQLSTYDLQLYSPSTLAEDNTLYPLSRAWMRLGHQSQSNISEIAMGASKIRLSGTGSASGNESPLTRPHVMIDGGLGLNALSGLWVYTDNPTTGIQDEENVLGVWKTYTPTLTSDGTNAVNPSGSITRRGRYMRVGKIVFIQIDIVIGASYNPGTGSWSISLPVRPQADVNPAVWATQVLTAHMVGGGELSGTAKIETNRIDRIYFNGERLGSPDTTAILVPPANARIYISGSYEAA